MSLKDIDLPDSITTGYEDPIEELFIPVLQNSVTYDVAVGYFTSGWLRDTAQGFGQFALSGGISRWVISPQLSKEDADSIINSSENSSILDIQYERNLIDLVMSLKINVRQELCSLISAGVLKFKIALPRNNDDGMLHAKIGIGSDKDGNEVAFSGSYNLTAAAKFNWEHIEIFSSQEPADIKRINKIKMRFTNLWGNNDPTYDVYNPSKKILKLIRREAGIQLQSYINAHALNNNGREIDLRDYQIQAINKWGENNGHGTFAMATGSGKTITALATIKRLLSRVSERKRPLVIVIVLPLKHLLDQWYIEAQEFGFDPIKCYESSKAWQAKISERMGVLNVTYEGYVMALVTNRTFCSNQFQSEIRNIDKDFLLVADEAHNLGAESSLSMLPDNANFRLALSATPDRHNDTQGTEALFRYFGKAVIEFSLEDAIDDGFLCPYEYYPHLCLLTDDEYEDYQELSSLIAEEAKKRKSDGQFTKEYLRLLGKRADLITAVDSKLVKLKDLLIKQDDESKVSHTLVYCGSRRGEDNKRHIERTVKLLGEIGVKTRKFTAQESLDERREILKLFASGDLETIAAIKCLDEGVDVPATRVAYILASTSNPKEYIQRRGRVLRKSKGKTFAVIHDFLVAPPPGVNSDSEMIERELERAAEFSRLALNKCYCESILDKLAQDNGISKWH